MLVFMNARTTCTALTLALSLVAFTSISQAKMQSNTARVRALQERIQTNPLDILAHNELGVFLAGRGDMPLAVRHLWLPVIIDESHVDGWSNLAMVLRKTKAHSEALAAFGRTLSLKAEQPEMWYSAGASLRALKRSGESMFALEAFLKYAAEGHTKRQKIERVLTKWRADGLSPRAPSWPEATPPKVLVDEIAKVVAKTAEAPSPDTPMEAMPQPGPSEGEAPLPRHPGDDAFEGQYYLNALTAYEAAARKAPQDGLLLYKLGATRAILGDPTGALRAWRSVLRQDPARLILNRQIAYATRRLADSGMVKTIAEPLKDPIAELRRSLLGDDPARVLLLTREAQDPEALFLRGEAALQMGKLVEAREAFERGLAASPDDRGLLGGRIEVMVRLDDENAEAAAQNWLDDPEASTGAFLTERALLVARRIRYGKVVLDSGDEFDEELE